MSVLHKLKALSVSLLDPEVGAWPAKTGGSGGGGCGIVRWGPEAMRIAKDGYLELFEEMLLTLLRMQREKSKVIESMYLSYGLSIQFVLVFFYSSP